MIAQLAEMASVRREAFFRWQWRVIGIHHEAPGHDRSTALREACGFSLALKAAGFTDSIALRLLRFGNIQGHEEHEDGIRRTF